MKVNETNEIKANEMMKNVKEMKTSELRKFKKQFDKYCKETIVDLGGNVVEPTTAVVKTVVETPVVVTAPVVAETTKEVEAETKAETKKAKTNKKSKKNKENKDPQWNQFFKSVRESGVKHGEVAPKGSNILALATKKSDKCVAAALVNHRGVATNVVYSPVYEYPLVFAKVTMDELRKIRKDIMDSFPADADIKKIGKNTTKNGKKDNFFYNEIEDGNFCCRFKREDGNTVYFGYIVDLDICFYRSPDGSIAINKMMYFFMPKWGTREEKDNYSILKDAILSLIGRAFNDDCKTVVIEDSKTKAESSNEEVLSDELSEEEKKARKIEDSKRNKEKNEKLRQEKMERQLKEEAEKQKAIEENGEAVKELPGGKKEITKADGTVIVYNADGVKERETAPDGTIYLYKPDGTLKRTRLPRKESKSLFRG